MVKSNLPPTNNRPCVLIIDDEETVRVALRAILQTDYDILEADSADRGMEVLQQTHADLVTMDVLMDGQSGLDALRLIRKSNKHRTLPVILITGHASPDGAREAFNLGATDYIQKPFGVEQVKTSIRNGLNGHLSLFQTRQMGEHTPQQKEKESSQSNLARLGQASAAFVHDLASPLQVMTILTTVCSKKLTSPEFDPHRDAELLDALGKMERLLTWSAELVKGWQTIAVPTALFRERLDVERLIDGIVEITKPCAELNGVVLSRASLPIQMEVYGDRVQLERALVNLVLNAIKASTARARTVEVGARLFQDACVFRVADSGLGFSNERMNEVLNGDPFLPAHKRRGLGLFIADWIAVNHGGKLQIICEKDLGTTVELFIPAGFAV